MQTIASSLDPRSEDFRNNRSDMLDMLAEMERLLEEVAGGGGEEAIERLRSRGKLPVRERVAALLDRDSPFLELSPLAAWNSNFPIGSGFMSGIGVVGASNA